ncbi:MAG: SDR family oxidoreductase [Rhodobacteraceae bacterium]|nr:SDR family oxidoreductase [Paracoccaceae bacterium]MBR9822846.1 SDR family oxidoreductase [Paracoccaceae bacterium]
MGQLDDKTVVVVGGVAGIGGAISERFAAEGATVYATSRRDIADAPAHPGIHPVRADATDSAALRTAFERITAERGQIDVLVFNAGMSGHAEMTDASADHYDDTFALNVRAALFATQAAAASIPEGGAIVLIGSVAGSIGTRGYGVYNASKAAIRSFARTWANELAPRGIRVNVVAPGATDTEMFASASEEVRATIASAVPLGRMARPQEVAAAALFLASDESSFVTGIELPVDGGFAQV